MTQVAGIKSLTIPNGAAVSNVLDAAKDYYGISRIHMIYAPAVLDALTFTIEVSNDNITFVTLTSDGAAAVTLPGAGKAKPYYFELCSARFLRIKASGNVAGDRIFGISGQEDPC